MFTASNRDTKNISHNMQCKLLSLFLKRARLSEYGQTHSHWEYRPLILVSKELAITAGCRRNANECKFMLTYGSRNG